MDQRTIELIQPNAETPNFTQPLESNEVIEANEMGASSGEVPGIDEYDFDGDGKVDEFEEAFARGDSLTIDAPPIPPAPSIPIPKLTATPIREEKEPSAYPTTVIINGDRKRHV